MAEALGASPARGGRCVSGIDQRTGVSQPGQDRGELGFAAGRTGQSRILCRTSGGSRRRAGRSSCMNMAVAVTAPEPVDENAMVRQHADLVKRIAHHLAARLRAEEHTSEHQSLMRISYAVF